MVNDTDNNQLKIYLECERDVEKECDHIESLGSPYYETLRLGGETSKRHGYYLGRDKGQFWTDCHVCDGTGLITQRVKVRVDLFPLLMEFAEYPYRAPRKEVRLAYNYIQALYQGYLKSDNHTFIELRDYYLARHKAGEKMEGVTVI